MLRDIHQFVFVVALKAEVLMPSDEETKELAKAYVKTAKHFPSITVPKKYEKWVALAGLGLVAAKVYARPAGMLFAVAKMQQNARKAKQVNGIQTPVPAGFEPAFHAN